MGVYTALVGYRLNFGSQLDQLISAMSGRVIVAWKSRQADRKFGHTVTHRKYGHRS